MTALGRPCVRAAKQGGRERPHGAAGESQHGAIGHPCRGEPAAERGQGKREEPQHHQGAGRLDRREAPEHGEHGGERVCGSDHVEPRCAQPVCGIRPQLRGTGGEGLQPASAEHRPGGQGRERGDRHDDGSQNQPGAPAGEEPQVSAPRRARRVGVVVELLPQLALRHAQGCQLRPRCRARPADARARPRDRRQADDGHHGGRPLRPDQPRLLADELQGGAPEGDREDREPQERHRERWRVRQPPVQLGRARREGPPPPTGGRQRCGGTGHPVARDRDESGRHEQHARTGQAGSHAEIEPLVGAGECLVDPVELAPRVGPAPARPGCPNRARPRARRADPGPIRHPRGPRCARSASCSPRARRSRCGRPIGRASVPRTRRTARARARRQAG